MADHHDIEGDIWDADGVDTAESMEDDTLDGRAAGLWRDLWLAAAFLTRLPIPSALVPPAYRSGERTPPPLAAAARAFPLVGVVVGALGALGIGIGWALGLHPLGLALLCLAVAAAATGALHEDGLADVADGFGGGRDRNEKLDILRDSRIGTYGVMALVFSVGLRVAALMSFATPSAAAFAFIAAASLSRAGLPVLMYAMAPARADGLGAGAGRPAEDGVIVAVVLAGLIGLLFAGFWGTIMAVVFAMVAMGAVAALADRQIGGLTGDVLGAAQQVGELAVLLGILWAVG